ncbi:MAG TPA: nucleoside-diphosphate kinase [Candidatus Nanoarchaeia archaeon]|nr:nucleoside-diphosphate kinase [Candidatus Nanoarchaeia archaeon]
MKSERTLVLIKPDGVKRGLIGEVIRRFEKRGLKIVALQMEWPSREKMSDHYPKDKDWITNLGKNTQRSYAEFKIPTTLKEDYGTEDLHEIGKKVREWLVDFMISGPIVKLVVEGLHAIKMVRKIVGPTIPAFAESGTIRGDFSIDSPDLANIKKRAVHNLIHASGNEEEAAYEIKHWFNEKDITSYTTAHETYAENWK